jgi:hypothetical protein
MCHQQMISGVDDLRRLREAGKIAGIFPAGAAQLIEDGFNEAAKGFVMDPGLVAKFVSTLSVKHFCFGTNETFANGLTGFISDKDLTRSIEQECKLNEGGKYFDDYKYVVLQKAKEEVKQDQATKLDKIKDKGHDGWTLDNFVNLEVAKKAKLERSHVAVIRLYTGALYKPWNMALRALVGMDQDPEAKRSLMNWATCVAVLYKALIMLSYQTKPGTVLRGLDESWGTTLPPSFTDPSKNEDGFAGGVEMGFMSRTRHLKIAYEFSGGPYKRGTIFEITFTAASRGANVQPFSIWPEEEELLFSPFTYLTVKGIRQEGIKRFIMLDASISTACPGLMELDLTNCACMPDGKVHVLGAPPPPPPAVAAERVMNPCGDFVLDLAGEFGTCANCGFKKTDHQQATQVSPSRRGSVAMLAQEADQIAAAKVQRELEIKEERAKRKAQALAKMAAKAAQDEVKAAEEVVAEEKALLEAEADARHNSKIEPSRPLDG